MANEPVRTLKGKMPFNFRKEWKVFAWCFVIAMILWTFTELNDQYTSSITVRARYINMPREAVFVKALPEDFKVMVTAKGWDLMGQYFRKKPPEITIDLNDYKKTDVLVTRRLQDNFEQVIAQKITVGEVFPEIIPLAKDEKGAKKVPVHLVQDFTYKNQFGLGGDITFSPDSVVVTGPLSLVKTIDHVETEDAGLKDIDKATDVTVKLKDAEFKNLSYSVPEVKVHIPVFQLTELTDNIPVEIIKQKTRYQVNLIPQKVSVIYQAPINLYSQIDSAQFQAVVDGSQIDTTAKQPLKVQLIGQPRYTYNVRLKPDYIDYVIVK